VAEHSDFDAAFSAGVGVTSRLWCRTLAGNMRTRLVPGERVADVAPTAEYPSLSAVHRAARDRPEGSIATALTFVVGGYVLGATFDIAWPGLIAGLIAALVLQVRRTRRRRAQGKGGGQRPIRALIMVTDRRLIEGMHPDELREIPLDRVKDVQVRSGSMGSPQSG
jgi:hypothetical protein